MAEVGADGAGLGRSRATFAALARAVCPSEGLTDELVDATVDDVAEFVAVLAPMTRRALRALAVAFEHGTRVRGHRPFSALEDDEAREVLARWNRGPLRMAIRLLRELVVVA